MRIGKFFILAIICCSVRVLADDRDLADSVAAANALHKLLTPQEEAVGKLLTARSLKCTFGDGYLAAGKNGKFEFSKGPFGAPTTIDSIDLKGKTARVIGNAGAADLAIATLANGINFIEAPGGTFNVYTVYWTPTGDKDEFYAVTSRHISILGVPAPSQYPGKCKIWGN